MYISICLFIYVYLFMFIYFHSPIIFITFSRAIAFAGVKTPY